MRENKSIISRTLENRVGICYVCFCCLDMIVLSCHTGDGWHICCWVTGFCDSLNYVSHWGRASSSTCLISLKSSRWPWWLTSCFQHWEAEAEGLPQIEASLGRSVTFCLKEWKGNRNPWTLEPRSCPKIGRWPSVAGDLNLGWMGLRANASISDFQVRATLELHILVWFFETCLCAIAKVGLKLVLQL